MHTEHIFLRRLEVILGSRPNILKLPIASVICMYKIDCMVFDNRNMSNQ